MTLHLRWIATASTILLCSCASENDSVRRATEANASAPSPASPEASGFLVEMVDARRMDYAEGSLAATRATTPELRNYGTEMMRDQTVLLKELQTVADSLQVSVSDRISEAKRGPLQGLTDKQGVDLDKRFISMITIDHERDVKAFTKASAFEHDPAVSAYAQRRLPLIQRHLDEINAIRERQP